MTYEEVVQYEMMQWLKAIAIGTDDAWKRYWANVKRAVTRFNNTHEEQIDIDALTNFE